MILARIIVSIFLLVNLLSFSSVKSQCYEDSDISIYQSGYGTSYYQQPNNQCIANFTLLNENFVDDNAGKGITCSRKGSTATDTNATWTYDDNGTVVECGAVGNQVDCERLQPGSVTIFGKFSGNPQPHPIGNYTCCIEGLCISIRLLGSAEFGNAKGNGSYPINDATINAATLESCIVIPPTDMTVIPQHYLVQMVTSGVPPSRLTSFIDCTNCDTETTFDETYYTLIDLNDERFQYTLPVTWSANSTSNIVLNYDCSIRLVFVVVGRTADLLPDKTQSTNITAANVPSVSYSELNATSVNITWSISGNVNGFVINITSSDLNTVTEQVTTDDSVRWIIIDRLEAEKDYNTEVRGYNQLLGPAGSVNVRLEAGISSINGSLLSVSNDLSNQTIQVNCYTFRVEPSQVTWMVDSSVITPDSSYSVLLDSSDMTYRHSANITDSFNTSTTISCNTDVNGGADTEVFNLTSPQYLPSIPSATILSSSSLNISWTSSSVAVNGYIIHYTTGGEQQAILVNGGDITSYILEGLTQGIVYQIRLYSYYDIPSTIPSYSVSILLDVPSITSFYAQSNTPNSSQLTWNISNSSIIDNYTVYYTLLCNNETRSFNIANGLVESINNTDLASGFEYIYRIIPYNILGNGTERTVSVIVQENDPPSVAPILNTLVTINSTAVRLSWNELNCTDRNATLTGYNIIYNIDEEEQFVMNVSQTTTETVITGLTEFRLYIISIAAVNNNGIGPYSQEYTVYTINSTITGLSVMTSLTYVQLSWEPLMNVTNVTYEYEVAYAIDSECSGNLVSLPDGYTVYSPRTSNSNIEVFELMSGTCYVFGVRVYVTISDSVGEFSVINGATVSDDIKRLTVQTSLTFAQLTWNVIQNTTIDNYFYEVGYALTNEDCSSITLNTLPQNYKSYVNTTEGSVEVFGLESDSCYVFGVRVYSARTSLPGEWQVHINKTISENTKQSSNAGAIAGGIVGTLLFLIMIIVIVIVILMIVSRYKSKDEKVQSDLNGENGRAVRYTKSANEGEYVDMDNEKPPLDDLYSTVNDGVPSKADVPISVPEDMYTNITEPPVYGNLIDGVMPPYDPLIPAICPVNVAQLGEYVSMNHTNMNSGFREQYKTLYTGEEKSCEIGQRDENKMFNRFKNITVYDNNRILLTYLPNGAPLANEFINAGYIDGYSLPKKYIACQGPLPKTVGDFWHMVWQEKVQFIVMLTNLMEEKKKKCARYWPEELNDTETYKQFKVTLLEEEPLIHFIIRTLNLELIGTQQSVVVKHYQYITWPDYGVPDSVSPFMTLNRRVMSSWNKDRGPIVVHCSAGVGRTGTFITVDMALEQAGKEGKVDIGGIVSRLREQRMKMVQTDAQYAFVHDAVLEAVVSGGTEIDCDKFETQLNKWRKLSPKTNKTFIEIQFELLRQVSLDEENVIIQTAKRYPNKNRMTRYLPPEKWRVLLKGESPDYVHGTFVHGYQKKKAFIIAQSPMESTVRDFLKMALIYKSPAIVMCCAENESRQETCYTYWDENQPVHFDDIVVKVLSVNKERGYIERELDISDDRQTNLKLYQLQILDWPSSGVGKSAQTLLSVFDSVGKAQRRFGKGPVIVHCSDTVGRSGMYCAISNTIEQCNTETLIDVFQATKAVRVHKPAAVSSLDQYNFIHDVVLRYLQQNSAYSNFQ